MTTLPLPRDNLYAEFREQPGERIETRHTPDGRVILCLAVTYVVASYRTWYVCALALARISQLNLFVLKSAGSRADVAHSECRTKYLHPTMTAESVLHIDSHLERPSTSYTARSKIWLRVPCIRCE